ncbi:MAG: hypothetical protein MGF17_00310 [Trichodesmium sp. MAG_R04]|nr:hypothetical protein [Trichodesmium sp. MAG_R04]
MKGFGLQWIRAIAQRFNKGGPAAIGDGRHQNQGPKPLLPEQQQALLVQVLEGEPPGGDRWSGPKVDLWISELLGRSVSPH